MSLRVNWREIVAEFMYQCDDDAIQLPAKKEQAIACCPKSQVNNEETRGPGTRGSKPMEHAAWRTHSLSCLV